MNNDRIVEKKSVICEACALSRAGLVTIDSRHIDIMSKYVELDGVSLVYLTYYYFPKIDYEHWVSPNSTNPLILQPTKERAIVEYILNEKWCDEGTLIEALKTYLWQFRNDELLFEVADFFGLERSLLDYWINEALTDLVDP